MPDTRPPRPGTRASFLNYHARMLEAWDALTEEAIRQMTRAQCIAWLEWNDHNGCFSDEDAIADGNVPLTLEDARQLLSDVRFERI